ncbi:MAG: YheC/YheD family protein, partial [Syntrophomonas sp.]|nr:YheC/YheD family protein [Syntrophomonas sp.]
DPNIQLFNTRFLDKWEVHQALVSNPTTSEMVPPTSLLSSINLKGFLDKYSEVFIKPRNNNAGRGIIKVIYDTSNIYNYSQSDTSPPKWRKCASFSNLWNHLINLIQNPDKYIVQTGIDLCRLDEQVFDLRAQVQKDGNGQWVFTGVNVRVATGNRFVTYPKVGKRVTFDKVIDIASKGSEAFQRYVNVQLWDLYHYVPRVLEKELDLSLGILSIDIGIDIHGRTWLIEVSSKSDSFNEDNIRARHFKYLMEYFLYITRENPSN